MLQPELLKTIKNKENNKEKHYPVLSTFSLEKCHKKDKKEQILQIL